tara:strand:- start:809 stop:2530 length:1722 start_codon:yes stop_codon:yes gene_type:complete
MIIGLLIAGINLPVSAQEVTQEAPAATQQKIALPYPMPEFYLIQKDGVNTYIKNAFGFIDKNPNSPFVHRVAMDLYIVGTYFKNQNLINTSRSFLLNSGANQLYGSFLISTFKTPQQLHDFIMPMISSDLPSIDKAHCDRVFNLIRASIHMQGWDFLKSPSFMVKCAALVDRAAPDDIKTAFIDQMDSFLEANSTEKKIADICFKRDLSSIDKIALLDAEMPDDQTARFVKMVYMVDLDQSQLSSSRMLLVRSQQLLQQGLYDLATPVIEQLITTDNQSQYRFWLGWCQASQGQTDIAQVTLSEVPSAPWRGAAQRLERQLSNLPTNLAQHSQIFSAMIQDLAANLDGLEMTVQGTLPDDKPFDLYVGIGSNQNVYLVLKENGRVQVAYHSDKDMCEIYLEKHARKFNNQGSVPIPIFDVVQNPESGQFAFQFAISVKPYAELAPAIQKCVSTDFLTTNEGLSKLMVGMIKKGAFPATPSQSATGINLKWMSPSLTNPQFDSRTFTVDTVGKLLAVSGSNVSITRIKYGPRDQMVLSAPSMPRASYVEATEADDAFRVTAYNRILKTLMTAMK